MPRLPDDPGLPGLEPGRLAAPRLGSAALEGVASAAQSAQQFAALQHEDEIRQQADAAGAQLDTSLVETLGEIDRDEADTSPLLRFDGQFGDAEIERMAGSIPSRRAQEAFRVGAKRRVAAQRVRVQAVQITRQRQAAMASLASNLDAAANSGVAGGLPPEMVGADMAAQIDGAVTTGRLNPVDAEQLKVRAIGGYSASYLDSQVAAGNFRLAEELASDPEALPFIDPSARARGRVNAIQQRQRLTEQQLIALATERPSDAEVVLGRALATGELSEARGFNVTRAIDRARRAQFAEFQGANEADMVAALDVLELSALQDPTGTLLQLDQVAPFLRMPDLGLGFLQKAEADGLIADGGAQRVFRKHLQARKAMDDLLTTGQRADAIATGTHLPNHSDPKDVAAVNLRYEVERAQRESQGGQWTIADDVRHSLGNRIIAVPAQQSLLAALRSDSDDARAQAAFAIRRLEADGSFDLLGQFKRSDHEAVKQGLTIARELSEGATPADAAQRARALAEAASESAPEQLRLREERRQRLTTEERFAAALDVMDELEVERLRGVEVGVPGSDPREGSFAEDVAGNFKRSRDLLEDAIERNAFEDPEQPIALQDFLESMNRIVDAEFLLGRDLPTATEIALTQLVGGGFFGVQTAFGEEEFVRNPVDYLGAVTPPHVDPVPVNEWLPDAAAGLIAQLNESGLVPALETALREPDFGEQVDQWRRDHADDDFLTRYPMAWAVAALDFGDPDVRQFWSDALAPIKVMDAAGMLPRSLREHVQSLFFDTKNLRFTPHRSVPSSSGQRVYQVEYKTQRAGRSFWEPLMSFERLPDGTVAQTGQPMAFELDPSDSPLVRRRLAESERKVATFEVAGLGALDPGLDLEERVARVGRFDPALAQRMLSDEVFQRELVSYVRRNGEVPITGGGRPLSAAFPTAQRNLDAQSLAEQLDAARR